MLVLEVLLVALMQHFGYWNLCLEIMNVCQINTLASQDCMEGGYHIWWQDKSLNIFSKIVSLGTKCTVLSSEISNKHRQLFIPDEWFNNLHLTMDIKVYRIFNRRQEIISPILELEWILMILMMFVVSPVDKYNSVPLLEFCKGK